MEGFFTDVQGLSEEVFRHIFEASSSIETDDGGRCSGTFISPDGLYLTALHCLGGVLRRHQLIEEPSLKAGELKIVRTLEQRPRDAFADGFFLGDNHLARDPRIVFLGRGLHFVTPDHARQMSEASLVDAISFYEDVALLKFDGLQTRAARVAAVSPVVGERVWHVSKPYAVARDHNSADGSTKYVTRGELVDPFTMDVTRDMRASCCDSCEESRLRQYYSANRFFSTLDFNNGSSGGGVFNLRGELVGLNAISLESPARYVAGSCGSHSAEFLARLLRESGR